MSTPEKKIENSILAWLNSIVGCFAFKVNTMGVYDTKRKVWRKNNNPHIHNGTCDIFYVYDGAFGAIEVKAGYNKPSDDQKKFMNRVYTCGGSVCWVNSLEQFKILFNEEWPDFEYKDKPLFKEQF